MTPLTLTPRQRNGQFRHPMPWERRRSSGRIPPRTPASTLLSDDPRGDFINAICDQIDHVAGEEHTLDFDNPAVEPTVKVGERYTLTLLGITHPVTIEKVFHTEGTPTACRWRLRVTFTAAPGSPATIMLTYQQWLKLNVNQLDVKPAFQMNGLEAALNLRQSRKGHLLWGLADGRVVMQVEQGSVPLYWEYYTIDELRALNPQFAE